jgi:hypothetical protein
MPANIPTPDVSRELARLGYVIGGDEQYTIRRKDGVEHGPYALCGVQEAGAAHGVAIWLLLRPWDQRENERAGAYCVNIGRVSQVGVKSAGEAVA